MERSTATCLYTTVILITIVDVWRQNSKKLWRAQSRSNIIHSNSVKWHKIYERSQRFNTDTKVVSNKTICLITIRKLQRKYLQEMWNFNSCLFDLIQVLYIYFFFLSLSFYYHYFFCCTDYDFDWQLWTTQLVINKQSSLVSFYSTEEDGRIIVHEIERISRMSKKCFSID